MNFDKLVDKAKKEFGEKARAGLDVVPIDVISTGIPSLDVSLGVGGWPIGCISQVYGPKSTGKSAMSYLSMAEAQRQGKNVALVDLEGSFYPEWASKLGVDPSKVLVLSPVSAEETSTYAVWCSEQEDIGFTVLDSIGAMSSERELDADGKKQAYGQSGIITQMVKQLLPRLSKNNQAFLIINQVRDKANHQNLPILKYPGGHALEHACSVVIRLKPGNTKYKNGKLEVGYRPIAIIEKNKVAPPNREAEWDFYYDETEEHSVGIDYTESLVSAAVKAGIIERRAAYYSYGEETHNGMTKLVEWIKSDEKIVASIRDSLIEHFENLKETAKKEMMEKVGKIQPKKDK